MNWRNVILYTLLGLGLLVALQVALSIIATIIGVGWAIATSILTLAVTAAMFYGGFKLILWYRGDRSSRSEASDATGMNRPEPNQQSRIDTLKVRYADGKLSESEFERQLERELDGPDVDSIDRELSREHE